MTYNKVFFSLGDPTRRSIFEHIHHSPASASELRAKLGVSQPAISQHIKILREAGLILGRRDGRKQVYHAAPGALSPLRNYLTGNDTANQTTTPADLPTDDIADAAQRWAKAWPGQNADVYAVAMRLLQLGRQTERSLKETADRKGLQGNELLMLDALALSERQSLTPSQLQRRLGVSKSAVTKILDRLETMGLVQRHAQTSDRRVTLVKLTEKAHTTLETILTQKQYGADHAAVKQLCASDMAHLARLLHKLHLLLEEQIKQG